jgi:hypothetical protein
MIRHPDYFKVAVVLSYLLVILSPIFGFGNIWQLGCLLMMDESTNVMSLYYATYTNQKGV